MAHATKLDRMVDVHQLIAQGDDGGSARTSDYVHMGDYDQILFIATSATITNACTLTVNQCTQDADGNSDAKVLSSGTGTISFTTAAADDNAIKTLLVTTDQMDDANSFDWLRIKSSGAAAAVLGVVGITYGARYSEYAMPGMES